MAKDFVLDAAPGSATLHITAQGLYRAFVNGVRAGDDLLTPGWTCYDDRIAYQSYKITGLLKAGINRIEIWLGDGWYRSQLMWAHAPIYNCYGDRIAALAEVEAAGNIVLSTNASWVTGLLQITQSGIHYGEDYDARIGVADRAGVEVLGFDPGLLVPHEAAGVKEMTPMEPLDSWADGDATVYDFGQNCGAYVRFMVEGEAGAVAAIQHSEVMGPASATPAKSSKMPMA